MEIDYVHCRNAAAELRESNDCSVRACAVALQVDYPTMRDYLANVAGRRPRKGMASYAYLRAIAELGATVRKMRGPHYGYRETFVEGVWRRDGVYVEDHYRHTRVILPLQGDEEYTSATVTTLARELATGTYLVGTRGHVLCLRDGKVHDWAAGSRQRIQTVHEVTV